MFILKFFASIIIMFFAIVFIFVIFSFLIARKAVSDLNDSLADKYKDQDNTTSSTKGSDIPNAIECPSCGLYHAEMPENNVCSCGQKLK